MRKIAKNNMQNTPISRVRVRILVRFRVRIRFGLVLWLELLLEAGLGFVSCCRFRIFALAHFAFYTSPYGRTVGSPNERAYIYGFVCRQVACVQAYCNCLALSAVRLSSVHMTALLCAKEIDIESNRDHIVDPKINRK